MSNYLGINRFELNHMTVMYHDKEGKKSPFPAELIDQKSRECLSEAFDMLGKALVPIVNVSRL